MIGRILKGHQVLDKIKDGSVGTVWRARTPRHKVVALKQLSAKNSKLSRKLKQFKREATLTARLNHRHVIKVYEYFPVKPQPFFTMEYFDSENLKYATAHLPKRVNGREFQILLFRHGDSPLPLLPRGQHDAEHLRCRLRVVVEHLVEITETEKQDVPGVALFDSRVLLHEGGGHRAQV